MGVSKNRGKKPKMDGENNGKPELKMDDLGVPLFLKTPICTSMIIYVPHHTWGMTPYKSIKDLGFRKIPIHHG